MALKWGFNNFARLVLKRGIEKRADTFIILYGIPRSGKTTLGFNIIKPYIKLMKELSKENPDLWSPPARWSKLLKDYFALSIEDMNKKIKNNPDYSLCFIDEGDDVFSWFDLMKKEQKELLKLIQKTGDKHLLTVLITPNLGILTKYILARATYMFIVIDEPTPQGNVAYVLKNYTNPFLAEDRPFGLKGIQKALKKNPKMAENKNAFRKYIIDRGRVVGIVNFNKIDQKLYSLYDKLVKKPSIQNSNQKSNMVSYSRYHKKDYALKTILYNLYTKDNKSVAQITRLLKDKFGYNLSSRTTVQKWINQISSVKNKPKLDDEKLLKIKKVVNVKEEEDIEVD